MRHIIETRSLADQVYVYIREKIISGEYKEGFRILEESVAAELGVSRTPIREAIRKLGVQGLVRIKPRSYAEVIGMNQDDVYKIAVVRAALEALALSLIISPPDGETMKELERLSSECIKTSSKGDKVELFEKESEFHLKLASLSGNEYLCEILGGINTKVQLSRVSGCMTKEKNIRMAGEHVEILKEISDGNYIKASELVKRHIILAAIPDKETDSTD